MNNENIASTVRQWRLIDAVLLGQYNSVLALLEEGVFVDTCDPEHEETALMLASHGKNADVTRLLIERGANVNLQDNRGQSALMHASRCILNMRLLIENGADMEMCDVDGRTALLCSIESGNIETVKLLLENGADKEVCDANGRTALLYSVASGDIEIVKLLLNYLSDPFAHGYGEKALECASMRGYVGIFDLLQKCGAEYS